MENKAYSALIRELTEGRSPMDGAQKCAVMTERREYAGVIGRFNNRREHSVVTYPAPNRHIAVAGVYLAKIFRIGKGRSEVFFVSVGQHEALAHGIDMIGYFALFLRVKRRREIDGADIIARLVFGFYREYDGVAVLNMRVGHERKIEHLAERHEFFIAACYTLPVLFDGLFRRALKSSVCSAVFFADFLSDYNIRQSAVADPPKAVVVDSIITGQFIE